MNYADRLASWVVKAGLHHGNDYAGFALIGTPATLLASSALGMTYRVVVGKQWIYVHAETLSMMQCEPWRRQSRS